MNFFCSGLQHGRTFYTTITTTTTTTTFVWKTNISEYYEKRPLNLGQKSLLTGALVKIMYLTGYFCFDMVPVILKMRALQVILLTQRP